MAAGRAKKKKVGTKTKASAKKKSTRSSKTKKTVKKKTAAAKPSSKSRAKAKTKSKAKAKSKTKTKAKAKSNAKTKTKSKAKTKTKAAPKPSTKRRAAKAAGKAKAAVKGAQAKASERRPIPSGPSARSEASGAKILTREFLLDLAKAVRKAVRPAILAGKGREIVGQAPSGDATFELDQIAEKALLNFLKRAREPVAYYSEDSGYTTFSSGQPQNLLVVDPIDGTRAARSGFEGCVVSVCSTRVIERPSYADVDNALVMEILGNKTFYAERGEGAKMYVDGNPRKIKLSKNTDLEQVSWSMTVPARPAELIFPVSARLIDLSSLKGGFFACNSSSYSLTRLVSNQLDACIDFANRFYRDIPDVVEDQFINAGRGVVMGVCPYDFAGGLLVAHEAGCTVTDAYGDGFEDVLLLDSTVTNHRSIIGAANPALYEKLFSFFDTRIKQYESLLKRRNAAAG